MITRPRGGLGKDCKMFNEEKLQEAERRRDNARMHEDIAKGERKAAQALETEAILEGLPFDKGDIIEFTTTVGFTPNKKRVTRRMQVMSAAKSYGGAIIHGRQYNASLQPAGQIISMNWGWGSDEFVKVLK